MDVDLRPFFLHARRAIIFEAMTYALIWSSIYQNVGSRITSKSGQAVMVSNPLTRRRDQNPRRVNLFFSRGEATGDYLTRSKLAACDIYDRDRNIEKKAS